jgi:hypothetical protein
MVEGPLTAALVSSAAAVLKPKACVHNFLCLLFKDDLQAVAHRNSGASNHCITFLTSVFYVLTTFE